MGKETAISWADTTVNFWQGCLKVSKECKFCYMYRDKQRYGQKGNDIHRSAKATFRAALKYKEPRLIFTCSWSDFFISNADEKLDKNGNVISHWRKDAWEIIKATPQHTWMILTKRPERIPQCLPDDWGKGYPNVWIGVSVGTQKAADFRIPKLFDFKCAVRFLSMEPLLEKVDISAYLKVNIAPQGQPKEWVYPIDWVIIGGESGNESGDYTYRPCRMEWIHEIVKQCRNIELLGKDNEIPVHVKQLGTSIAKQIQLKDRHGTDHDEAAFPNYLKFKQMPKCYDNLTK